MSHVACGTWHTAAPAALHQTMAHLPQHCVLQHCHWHFPPTHPLIHQPTICLQVTTVQPLAATLRHTAPFFPQPHPLAGGPAAGAGLPSLPRCLAPLDLMVQLEGSGKWPDAPAAYSKMKAALGCQLAQALEAVSGVRWGARPWAAASACLCACPLCASVCVPADPACEHLMQTHAGIHAPGIHAPGIHAPGIHAPGSC
jgi:hypothetical protein